MSFFGSVANFFRCGRKINSPVDQNVLNQNPLKELDFQNALEELGLTSEEKQHLDVAEIKKQIMASQLRDKEAINSFIQELILNSFQKQLRNKLDDLAKQTNLVCSITLEEYPDEPVLLSTSPHVYSQASINKLFWSAERDEKTVTCPQTRQPISPSNQINTLQLTGCVARAKESKVQFEREFKSITTASDALSLSRLIDSHTIEVVNEIRLIQTTAQELKTKALELIARLRLDKTNRSHLTYWSDQTKGSGGEKIEFINNYGEIINFKVPKRIQEMMNIASRYNDYQDYNQFEAALDAARKRPLNSWADSFFSCFRKLRGEKTKEMYNPNSTIESLSFK